MSDDIATQLAREMERAEYARLPIDQLKGWDRNPRANMDEGSDRLAQTIGAVGWGADVLVQRSTMRIIGGHLRLRAARKLGLDVVPCKLLDVDDRRADEIALADNRASEFADWDSRALNELLQEMDADRRGAIGWADDDLGELLADIDRQTLAEQTPERRPEPEASPVADARVAPGELWALGRHRLLCGDCRTPGTLERLSGGRPVNLAFTSPPYASQRKYDESSGFEPIPPDAYSAWWADVQSNVRATLADDASLFVNIKEHCADGQRHLYVKRIFPIEMVERWGWRFIDEFAWVRQGVPGRWPNRFKNGWEPVFHFSVSASVKFRPMSVGHWSDGVHATRGRHSPSGSGFTSGGAAVEPGIAWPNNVVSAPTDTRWSTKHSAVFPVKLPSFFVLAYTDPGDSVLDPFLGSGTTLIAAEQTNRVGLGCEISPAYCGIIIDRWQQLTGETAERLEPPP